MVRLDDIVDRVLEYNPEADVELIKKAYVFSGVVHQGQTRVSGEPYLDHPLEVANILTGLKLDAASVATGLLHDTVEDTHTTVEKIEENFGKEVATLVDGLTKLSKITFEKKEDREAENFRKMILAMGKDIRIILIKLADRLHNMRTLAPLAPAKQKKISLETLDIYAPLANRLGMGWIKTELEDLAFRYLEPEKFAQLSERIEKERAVRDNFIDNVKKIIEEKLVESKIAGEVTGRPKQIYSIFKKMEAQDVEFENIYDITAFRVIVDSVRDCYAFLGVVHAIWKPVPGRFKDYIALPKGNMYQSLHTTVIGPYGVRMEIQIRTAEMHRVAEYGIAAHWKYKEGKDQPSSDEKSDKNFAWLRQLVEWQRDLKDSDEFLETLKADLFPTEVFVFTPKGAIKEFSEGATVVDFAYSIHSDVGNTCIGAKVNGRIVPLKYEMKNGDVVEILTLTGHNPSKDWLKFVKSSKARTRIRHWVKTKERSVSVALGKEICEKEFSKNGLEFGKIVKSGEIERVAKENFAVAGTESLLASIGYGKISAIQLVGKFVSQEKLHPEQKVSAFRRVLDKFKPAGKREKTAVMVRGADNIMVRFAKCCNPLPGDAILGFITQGQGVSVHTRDCPNIMHIDKDRRIEVEWDSKEKSTRPAKIELTCKNEKGLLAEISNAIKAADANIVSAEITTTQTDRALCKFEIEVNDLEHLKGIIRALQKIKKVIKVERAKKEIIKEQEAIG